MRCVVLVVLLGCSQTGNGTGIDAGADLGADVLELELGQDARPDTPAPDVAGAELGVDVAPDAGADGTVEMGTGVACVLATGAGCPVGKKCIVGSSRQCGTICVTAGSAALGEACASLGCARGLYCWGFRCVQLCESDDDCGAGRCTGVFGFGRCRILCET